MIISNKRRAGLALIMVIMAFRSIVLYHYVGGVINVWNSIAAFLTILPLDGIIAGVYGLWSREKRIAFTIGVLPTILTFIVNIESIIKRNYFDNPYGTYYDVSGIFRNFFYFGGVAVGMGLMGFGSAKWKENGKNIAFLGIIIWLFTLMSTIMTTG